VRSILTITAVVATVCILSACVGENKHQVMASCRLQYSDGNDYTFEWFKKIRMCMEAHGFEIDQERCIALEVADCYKPTTLDNKLRAVVD
jgi:hypothetical protein